MLPEALERPCLVGPRNETVDEKVGLFAESGYEKVDRPLWIAIDEPEVAHSKDEEDVGPFGESRDDEDVGRFGESRDEEGSLRQGHEEEEEEEEQEEEQEEEEEEAASSEQDLYELIRLAASSVSMMAGVPANTRDATSSQTTTTLPTEPQESRTSSSPPITSTPSTPSRKRARDSEDLAEDESRHKRIYINKVIGTVRNAASAAKVPQHVEAPVDPETQQPKKRVRSLDDDFEDIVTERTPKRLRLYQQTEEIPNAGAEYITAFQANAANNDDSTLVDQDTSSSETQEVDDAPTNTNANEQDSVGDESPANDEVEEREDAAADEEAAPTETEWDTAHGINSECANTHVRGMAIYGISGEREHLLLPTSTGLPDRAWTEEEKEDLRVYIQDYGIKDWAPLARSTNRPEEELQYMYFEVVTGRNVEAGRPECDGIPEAYPDFTSPPAPLLAAPQHSDNDAPSQAEDDDNESEIEEGEIIEEDESDREAPAPSPLETGPMSKKKDFLNGVRNGRISKSSSCRGGNGEAEQREQVPSSEPMSNGKKGSLNASVEEEQEEEEEAQDSEVKQEDSESECGLEVDLTQELADLEEILGIENNLDDGLEYALGQQAQTLPAPEARISSAKGPLGPKFAGVSKLAGSSRRGVPPKAAWLKK